MANTQGFLNSLDNGHPATKLQIPDARQKGL